MSGGDGSTVMMRFLIILGIAIIVLGLLGPYLSRLGLGRLPGDVVIEREGGSFYFPFSLCITYRIAGRS